MDFVDQISGDETWCLPMNLKDRIRKVPLYSKDLVVAAKQRYIMTIGDQLNSVVYPALMKHGTDDILLKQMNQTLQRLEILL